MLLVSFHNIVPKPQTDRRLWKIKISLLLCSIVWKTILRVFFPGLVKTNKKKEKQSSRGAFARGKTQVDGAQSRVTVKIYTMYKVKNRRKMAVHVASQ